LNDILKHWWEAADFDKEESQLIEREMEPGW
jgi:hypothetical protein